MHKFIACLLLVFAVSVPTAEAQSPEPPDVKPDVKGVWLTTEFPVVTVRAGEEARFNISLVNRGLPPQRATFSVENAPKGWGIDLRGGGRTVGAAYVDYNGKTSLDLKIKLPSDAQPGQQSLVVKAQTADRTFELPLTLTVQPETEEALTAEPKLPTLRGTSRSTFDFRVSAKNDSAETMLVTLSAQAPRGFQVTFKEGYGSQELTSIPIKAGENKDLAIDVKPPQGVAARQYPVTVQLAADRAKGFRPALFSAVRVSQP